jgi:hypothetical protein
MQLLSSRVGEWEALMKEGTAKEKINLARRLISDVVVLPGKIRLSLIRTALQAELLGEAILGFREVPGKCCTHPYRDVCCQKAIGLILGNDQGADAHKRNVVKPFVPSTSDTTQSIGIHLNM